MLVLVCITLAPTNKAEGHLTFWRTTTFWDKETTRLKRQTARRALKKSEWLKYECDEKFCRIELTWRAWLTGYYSLLTAHQTILVDGSDWIKCPLYVGRRQRPERPLGAVPLARLSTDSDLLMIVNWHPNLMIITPVARREGSLQRVTLAPRYSCRSLDETGEHLEYSPVPRSRVWASLQSVVILAD